MKAVIVDGSRERDPTGQRVLLALTGELEERRWSIEHIPVREKAIAHCAGDFFCWTRTPGLCKNDDDNRAVGAAVVGSDLAVYLTPVTFGGYSSQLKCAVDHLIPLVMPFFATVEGETHHEKRYERYPSVLAVGWTEQEDFESAAIFRHLVARFALNAHAPTFVSGVVNAAEPSERIAHQAVGWLDDLVAGRSSSAGRLPVGRPTAHGTRTIRRALLVVGSPRGEKSTSNRLGQYLLDRLEAASIETRKVYARSAVSSATGMRQLADEVAAADLVVLASPLYVDSLPAPVMAILEALGEHSERRTPNRPLFAAIVNCGFPEAHHCTTALAICERFARQADFDWAGGLAMGGGEVISGQALDEVRAPLNRLKSSLASASDAMARGERIPQEAVDAFAKPLIPHWVYRLIGDHRFKSQAKKHGSSSRMGDTPHAEARM